MTSQGNQVFTVHGCLLQPSVEGCGRRRKDTAKIHVGYNSDKPAKQMAGMKIADMQQKQ